MHPRRGTHPARTILSATLAGCLALCAGQALAQSTGATIRGQVIADASPASAATVTAVNTATGLRRSVQSGTDGRYVLTGLPPGTYRIDVVAGEQAATRELTVQVGQTATVDLGVGGLPETAPAGAATTLDTVQVTGVAIETRTSEIASYITQRQIEALPQGTRNFLAFADTVPGVQFRTGTDGSTRLQSGAQSGANINVFIDGVGQKDYVLRGGVSGQDTSRGNPFPQSAIGQYKVITSNYKAEYDQLSSAAITAVTRSGGNQFDGSFFWDRTSTDWRRATEFERDNDGKIPSKEEQYGVSFGGPIVRDRAHFFLAYEAKEYTSPRAIIPGEGYTVDALPPALRELAHDTTAPFKEDLYFGKIDWSIGQAHLLELTLKYRDETELTNVGNGPNTASYGTARDNDETRVDLRYQFSGGNWLNDAHLTFEESNYNPRPLNAGFGYVLTTTATATDPNDISRVILRTGAGGDYQNKGQEGWSLQNDLTFTGWSGHTLKMGVKWKRVELGAQEQQPYYPQYFYDIDNSLAVPYRVRFGAGLAGIAAGSASSRSTQVGLYIQDDWEVTERLTLNIGVRWDYEESPTYLDYTTPQAVVDALHAPDPRAADGHSYAESLARGGIDIARYISTGNNRSAATGAWQPRLGFSYDLSGDQRHVVFGGAGRAYDRTLFDWLQLEVTKATFPSYEYAINAPGHPCAGDGCLAWGGAPWDQASLDALVAGNPGAGREIDLLHNDLKTPYSDQFSLGIRNVFGLWGQQWNSSVTLQRIESHDGFAFMLGNRLPDGSFFAAGTTWGAPWGAGVPGYGALLLGTNGIETRANSLLVSLDKPYTDASGWGMTLAYTYTDAKENRQFGEHYALDYPDLADFGWKKAGGVPEHRLVATGIYDGPWNTTLSAKLTLATPTPRYGTNCLGGWNDCVIDQYTPEGTLGFKQFDLALIKEWDTGSDWRLRLRADLLNVFDWVNYAGYDDWWGAPGEPSAGFGTPNSQFLPTRTFKLSIGFDW